MIPRSKRPKRSGFDVGTLSPDGVTFQLNRALKRETNLLARLARYTIVGH